MFSRRRKIRRSSATRFLRDYRIVWSLASDGLYRRLRNALAAQSMIYRKNPISFTLGSGTYPLTIATLFSSSLRLYFSHSPSSRGFYGEFTRFISDHPGYMIWSVLNENFIRHHTCHLSVSDTYMTHAVSLWIIFAGDQAISQDQKYTSTHKSGILAQCGRINWSTPRRCRLY